MRPRGHFRQLGAAALLALLAGCPLPEDQFVLSGHLGGNPRPGVEVRLLRNQVSSDTRCDALEPLETTLTDEAGRYSFTLIRQQVTRGVNARRFFRVETGSSPGAVVSQSFWFPDADLALGELSGVVPAGAWRVSEYRVDERLAWRAELNGVSFAPDRPYEWRVASTLREWRTVPIDSLGRYDIVPVEWRVEGPWEAQTPELTAPPLSRGGECPDIDVTPCPLTDGRYVPYEFPPNTRTIVLNFKHEVSVNPIALHGLVLERPAAMRRLEFNFVEDFDNWNKLGTSPLDGRLQELSLDRCNEPGLFVGMGSAGFIKPVLLRIAFEDAAGDLVPIVSLSEISTR
jgi:hypothetical protein